MISVGLSVVVDRKAVGVEFEVDAAYVGGGGAVFEGVVVDGESDVEAFGNKTVA